MRNMKNETISFYHDGIFVEGKVIHQDGHMLLVRVTFSTNPALVRQGQRIYYEMQGAAA